MMKYFTTLGLFLPFAALAAPSEEAVQGLYEGTWEKGPAEVRVVALGENSYRLMARQTRASGIHRAELPSRLDGDTLSFGDAAWRDGALSGSLGTHGNIAIKKVERTSPTLGKQAPAGATVVIGPEGPSGMIRSGNRPWYLGSMEEHGKRVDEATLRKNNHPSPNNQASKKKQKPEVVIGIDRDGSFQVPRGGMQSKDHFPGSFNAHVEFRCNLVSKARSQGRGNSGVFLPNGKEIQVLDSFGTGTYLGGGCGGLYKFKDPETTLEPVLNPAGKDDATYNLSSLPPLSWQTYDIEFREQAGPDGKTNGYLTVYHNGRKIHDRVEMRPGKGAFRFQDHGNPVRYRNIWVQPVK